MASAFKLGNAAGVTTWYELVAAITNGYPVTICCNQGFDLTRDADGFCAARDLGPLHGHRWRSVRPARGLHPSVMGTWRSQRTDHP